MKYALLLYADEAIEAGLSDAEREAMMAEYGEFTASIEASGHFVSGEPLALVRDAISVRRRGGQRMVTDGPFAETREQLGGFYVIQAESLEEAAEIASRIPAAGTGTVEVRPIPDFGG
jgi:hypothetical protein